MADTALLVPRPQHAASGEPWTLPFNVRVGPLDEDLQPALDAALDKVAGELARRGSHLSQATEEEELEIRLVLERRGEAKRGPEAHELRVGPTGVEITAAQPIGLLRGLTTLTQWLRLQPPTRSVCGLFVRDWPDVARRGLMLDVSRNRVPRMGELYALVDLLSELKLNELQLYLEHTFAYAGHERVWHGWSPLDAGEMRRLEAYARRRGVELVPNQNSFGHFHRWLIHEPYRRLAECPEGIEHPFSPDAEPFSLCPMDLGSLRLLADLYRQLLPNFRSQLFNAGLDETLDLGQCRSREACEQRGKARVYTDYLLRVRALVAEHRKRLMFWGDVMLEHRELIPSLPQDVIPMIWGYEADHDFSTATEPFAAAGLDFYLCPGTASWNSWTGRTQTALGNLAAAALHSRSAFGYLITDWGDHGHLQPTSVSWPAYVAGAAFAWNRESARRSGELPLADLLDRHVLLDPAGEAGAALCRLGEAQAETGVCSLNGAPLFFAWMLADKPAAERRGEGLTGAGLDACLEALEGALHGLARSSPRRPDAELIRRELEWAVAASKLGASLARARLGAEDEPVEELPGEVRGTIRDQLDAVAESLAPVWLARSRPGGLAASVERFTALRPRLA